MTWVIAHRGASADEKENTLPAFERAIALGADFVFVGRPFLYAASIGGAGGVARAIALMSEELKRNMSLVGISRLSDLNADFVVPTDANTRRGWSGHAGETSRRS